MFYRIISFLYNRLYKIEDGILLICFSKKKYNIYRFKKGNGLYHKFIFHNKYNDKKYLIKKPTYLTDFWQWVTLNFFNKKSGYMSFSRKYVGNKIKRFLTIKELSEVTPCICVNDEGTVIYRYLNVEKEKIEMKEVLKIQKLLAFHNFKFVDDNIDNYIKSNNKVYLIDLESIEFI